MATDATERPSPKNSIRPRVTNMDHIVLRVRDIDASLDFYTQVLGLEGELVEEFRAGSAPFPLVRINERTIIDLFPSPEMEPIGGDSRNQDHFCLAIEPTDMSELLAHFLAQGIRVREGPVRRSGARGQADSIYIFDPDDNVVEIRCY